MPKFTIHSRKITLETILADVSLMGMAVGQHENRSLIVRRYWYPWHIGNGPTMSTCMRETGDRFAEGANWGFGMSVHFTLLTFQTLGNPLSGVRVHVGQYKAIGDELDCGLFAQMV